MKYLVDYKIFESTDSIIEKSKEFFLFLKDDGVDFSMKKNEPGILLRGFSRIVGGGKIPDYTCNVSNKRMEKSFVEFSSEVNQLIIFLDECGYKIQGFSIYFRQGNNPQTLVVYNEEKPMNASIQEDPVEWCENFFINRGECNIKEITISFIKK